MTIARCRANRYRTCQLRTWLEKEFMEHSHIVLPLQQTAPTVWQQNVNRSIQASATALRCASLSAHLSAFDAKARLFLPFVLLTLFLLTGCASAPLVSVYPLYTEDDKGIVRDARVVGTWIHRPENTRGESQFIVEATPGNSYEVAWVVQGTDKLKDASPTAADVSAETGKTGRCIVLGC